MVKSDLSYSKCTVITVDPYSLYKEKLDNFDFPFFSEEEEFWIAYKLKLCRKIPFSLIDFFLEDITIIFSLL